MKIKVDDKEILNINSTKLKVLSDEIPNEILQEDCCRRLNWVLMHKYETCFEKLKKEWEPKLKSKGIRAIPLDEDEFAELVFSQPDYKDRSARDNEKK